VVGHFHFVMGVAAMFGNLRRGLLLVPQDVRRMMSETLGKWHFWLTSSAS